MLLRAEGGHGLLLGDGVLAFASALALARLLGSLLGEVELLFSTSNAGIFWIGQIRLRIFRFLCCSTLLSDHFLSFSDFTPSELPCGLTIHFILTVLDLAVGMVPLFALVAADPHLAIGLRVFSLTEVDLLAVITHFIVEQALVAELAETDGISRNYKFYAGEFGLLLGQLGRLKIGNVCGCVS